ncbi:MAG: hypothetical protein BWX88_00386 [Planctomycetes bacterium ADurb.Bin126]|nr:MAG: hypothetical protein BWX88_00386 [Planctomycetes bacterium ADurb.Bin126]
MSAGGWRRNASACRVVHAPGFGDVADDELALSQEWPGGRVQDHREEDGHRQASDQGGLPKKVPHPAEDRLAHDDGEHRGGDGDVPGREGRQGQGQQQSGQERVRAPQQGGHAGEGIDQRLGDPAGGHAQAGHGEGPPAEEGHTGGQRSAGGEQRDQEDRVDALGGAKEGSVAVREGVARPGRRGGGRCRCRARLAHVQLTMPASRGRRERIRRIVRLSCLTRLVRGRPAGQT